MNEQQTPKIEDVLFPVELLDICYRKNGRPRQRELFEGKENSPAQKHADGIAIPGYRALVDLERNHVFSVVSKDYRLVTNGEAVEMGRQCFKSIFSVATMNSMDLYNIIMPFSRSFCHVDFMARTRGIEPWAGDTWAPFLRVTNSYNRTKMLGFDLGFCR